MTTLAQPVTGQDINVAARAVRRLLDVLLAEAGTSFPPFATLNTLALRGPSVARDPFVRELATGLQADEATVRAILRELQSRGLVRQTSPLDEPAAVRVELTAEGEAEQRRLGALAQAATRQLYSGIDADDLATTRRVLVTVTERVTTQLRSAEED
jgi:DNA-binding MarR family transcriptional regulator